MTEIIDIIEPAIPGSRGPQGPAGEIADVTATALPTGADPTVTLGGTPSERTIEFGLPRGPKGDPGSGSVNSVNGDFGPDIELGPMDIGGSTGNTPGTIPIRGGSGELGGIGDPIVGTDAATKGYVDAKVANPSINLDAEGVPGDGVTPADAGIQAVINSAPVGSTITAPLGKVYLLTGEVELTKPVTITGVSFTANAGGRSLIIASDDVVLDGITVTGPGASAGVVSEQFFVSSDGTSEQLRARSRIVNSRFIGCQESHLWLSWLTDFTIENNLITDGNYAGVMLLSPKGGIVRGNTIRGIWQGGNLVNSYGIAITDIDNTLSARAENVLVEGNSVFDVPGWEGIDTHGGKNIRIIGNSIVGCPNPIAVTVGSDNRVSAPEGCIVSGNYMERGNITGVELAGIVFNGKTGGGHPDRFATGAIGENVIRGFQRDLIMDYVFSARTTVEPQSHDGPVRRTPTQIAFRQWAATSSITVPANAMGGTSQVTFPSGYFTIPPVVVATKAGSMGARFVPYVDSITATGCKIGVYLAAGAGEGQPLTIPISLIGMQTGAIVNGPTGIN